MNKLSKLCLAMAAGSACAMSANTFALNIVLTNDDSWDTTNINVMKSALEAAGHDVIMSAPCTGQSGKGGAMSHYRPVSIDESLAGEQEYCVGDTDTSVAFKDYVLTLPTQERPTETIYTESEFKTDEASNHTNFNKKDAQKPNCPMVKNQTQNNKVLTQKTVNLV